AKHLAARFQHSMHFKADHGLVAKRHPVCSIAPRTLESSPTFTWPRTPYTWLRSPINACLSWLSSTVTSRSSTASSIVLLRTVDPAPTETYGPRVLFSTVALGCIYTGGRSVTPLRAESSPLLSRPFSSNF